MRRKPLQIIRDAWNIMYRDVRNFWIAGVLFAGYFLVGRFFLNSMCPMVTITGFPCPGCGMTRAVISILKGNFAAAWYLHPFSYAFVLLAAVFVIRRYFLKKDIRCLGKYLIAIFAGMIVYYIYRMVRYFPGEPPMSYYYGSLGYRMFSIVFH